MVRLVGWATLLVGSLAIDLAAPVFAQPRPYNPIVLTPGKPITDKLSTGDIPTGQGGFARDYVVQLQAGTQVTVDVSSTSFDSMVYLLNSDGATIAENDDGPDGSSNSSLVIQLTKSGAYTIRVQSIGEKTTGNFTLRVTSLK